MPLYHGGTLVVSKIRTVRWRNLLFWPLVGLLYLGYRFLRELVGSY